MGCDCAGNYGGEDRVAPSSIYSQLEKDAELSNLLEPAKSKKHKDNFSLDFSFDYDINLLKYFKLYKNKVIEKPVLYNQVGNSILGFTYTFQDGDADVVNLNYKAILEHQPKGPFYLPRDNVSFHEKKHNDNPYATEEQVRYGTQTH